LAAGLGDRPAAKKLFARARELVAAQSEESQPGEWRVLATAEAKAGEVEETLATTRRIPEGNQFRDITFQEVASELAKARREKDALRVGALIENDKTKEWLLPTLVQQVALAHAKAGDVAGALRVAERIKDPTSRVAALAGVVYFNLWNLAYPNEPGIALLQAEAGDKAGAQKTLRQAADVAAIVTGDLKRAQALTDLACAQARLGDVAAARKTAEDIDHKEGKLIALATIARVLAGAGQVKEAMAVVDRRPDTGGRMFVLMHVGAGQVKAGDRKGARETFRQAHLLVGQMDDQERNGMAHSLAGAQAEAGDYEGAVATTKAFLPEGNLADVNIAYSRAEAGDFAEALKMAEQLKSSDWWKPEDGRTAQEHGLVEGQPAARHRQGANAARRREGRPGMDSSHRRGAGPRQRPARRRRGVGRGEKVSAPVR
jgi:hypothetical protein